MVSNVDGYQFDNVKVSAENDARLYHILYNRKNQVIDGYDQSMNLSSSGLTVKVGAGAAVIQGRMVVIRQEESITVPANSSGYISLTVDLTQEVIPGTLLPESEEYEWTNNQVKLEFITKIVEGNLNNGDKVYNLPLCSVTSTGSTVSISKITDSYELILSKGEVLWRGTALMHDTQTVQPSKQIWQTTSGFLLVWLPYENGQVVEDRYVTTPFYKERIIITNVLGEIVSGFDDYHKKWFSKRINYNSNSNVFTGAASNASGDNSKMVLRYIVSF
ncbi:MULTISPECIES: hypothetical protein [unclassified Enterococcus]|uniref:hypothetical protein n=1 Tax=unclassified Enterococcus TaxID=2608891 RepID=UPI0013EB4A73|nr:MULTISPECIES: hypothetical protein [unclassified Enterococcus]